MITDDAVDCVEYMAHQPEFCPSCDQPLDGNYRSSVPCCEVCWSCERCGCICDTLALEDE